MTLKMRDSHNRVNTLPSLVPIALAPIASKYIAYLICYVTLQDHYLNGHITLWMQAPHSEPPYC